MSRGAVNADVDGVSDPPQFFIITMAMKEYQIRLFYCRGRFDPMHFENLVDSVSSLVEFIFK